MIDVAIDAAREAGELAYRYFKTQPKISYKPDNTPVTRADIEVEKLIRKIISKKYPDHGIIGEELPPVNPKAKYQWIIDPIDGTKSFIKSLPLWSTLLAVLEDNKPIIGISYFPTNDELFIAQKDKGTYLNGQKIRVSQVKDIKSSFLIYGAVTHFEKVNKLNGLINVCKNTKSVSGIGWTQGFNLLIKGKVEIVMDTGNLYDFAAPAILTKEAGGKFTDFVGRSSFASGSMILTNGLLHQEVLKLLNSK